MAKYECAMCGKTLGLMETISREFQDDKNRGLCPKCHQYFVNTVKKRLDEMNDSIGYNSVKQSIPEQIRAENGNSGYEYVEDYFKYQEAQNLKEENARWEACPVCGKIRDPQEDICGNCGYIYTDIKGLSKEDYVKAAKTRFEQYRRNPLYEYKVEVVQESGLTGAFKKADIQNVLAVYALDGWRLHTAVTNELGKMVLSAAGVGTNATVDQMILIFERCIKDRTSE